ncbi:hypothetical protein [Paraburkholderia caribensis]|uniref:hypothetical protein n=1 Tax=Paraburkholderia caribensis TaxID=75105 RepID=UPI0031D1B587
MRINHESSPASCAIPAEEQGSTDKREGMFYLNDRFDSLTTEGITVDAAVRALNDANRSLQALSAITQILHANQVAKDCCEPHLGGNLVGGLLMAAQLIANNMENEIDQLGERAQRRREKSHE